MGFKKDFMWGTASASYQVEGAYNEDGKGLNVWDYYCQDNPAIAHCENGNVACDQYHLYKDDIAKMKEIGIKYYRFSISWTRIIPNGTGEVNPKGIEYYNNLIDELIANGIEPLVTMFHWDYPMELHKLGGWLNPSSSDWFEEYAKILVENYSDRVKYWITLNEPQVFVGMGYDRGIFAPFQKCSTGELCLISKNVILSHGKAVKVLREHAKQEVKVGFAPTGPVLNPRTNSTENIELARQKSFDFGSKGFVFSNSWWADPIILGKYPDRAYELFGDAMPTITAKEWNLISQPLDFYGVNIYQADAILDINGVREEGHGKAGKVYTQGKPITQCEWPIDDDCLYWSCNFLYDRYKLPILITENGMANNDRIFLDGKVHDPLRIDFLTRYLRSLKKASDEGIDIMGYMYWSVLDNFEWADGYDKRFGLIYVDYQTQQRTIKDSGYWYKSVIESNGENL
jgi:beta-glucosidase